MNSLENGPAFCILPWLHFNLQTNGNIYTCCDIQRNEKSNLGNINDVSIEEIWNHPNIRRQRLKMLKNIKVKECNSCYKTESAGQLSKRQKSNEIYKDYIAETKDTLSNGTLEKINLRDIAFHFSNLCNFSCRTCGPESSSSWANEIKNISPQLFINNKGYKLHNRNNLIWKKFENHSSLLEKVYFAGGEPLINTDHYYFLQHLAEKKLFHIKLAYNTNLSTLTYKSFKVLDIWKNFPNTFLSISLDCHGARGEYIRKGLKWSEIYKLRKEIEDHSPHIQTEVCVTLSVFNVLQIPDFYDELINKNFIKPSEFNINFLFDPCYFSAQILPYEMKVKASKIYQNYIKSIIPKNSEEKHNKDLIEKNLNSVLNFLFENDKSYLLPEFYENVELIDKSRGENFAKTFPELAEMKIASSQLKNFWIDTSSTWDENRYTKYFSKILYSALYYRIKITANYINKLPEHTQIIELGCGVGRLAKYLDPKKKFKYLGVDISETALKKARLEFKDQSNYEWEQFDLKNERHFNTDLLVSLGLFDWLDEKSISRMILHSNSKYHIHSFSEKKLTLRFILHTLFTRVLQLILHKEYKPRYFTANEILSIFEHIKGIQIFRNSRLLSFGAIIHNLDNENQKYEPKN